MALTLAWGGAAGADPDELAASLAKARRWVKKDLRYADAIVRLEAVLANHELSATQRVEANELLAYAAVAIGDPAHAEQAFSALLDHDPTYRLPTGTSPKVAEIFERTRAHRTPPPPPAQVRTATATRPEGLALIPAVDSGPPSAEAADQREAWYQKWWLWTIIGAAAVGGASAAIVLSRPSDAPRGTLDPISVP